jgi:hypothetical protein
MLHEYVEALYDNESEWPDELAFKRGDILQIIHRQPIDGNLAEGWWYCTDKYGRNGIAPANRLNVLSQNVSKTHTIC